MKIRAINRDELERYGKIDADAFVAEPDEMQRYITLVVEPYLENTRVLVNDNNEFLTQLHMIFHDIWFGRSTLPMPGILGVATPVEHRRKGYLKTLLVETLKELYEKGYSITALYPFYFPFYKKFGFEHTCTLKSATIKMEQFLKFKAQTPGKWVEKTADDWQEFEKLYRAFCYGRFGAMTRDERIWRNEILTFQHGKIPRKNYMWYNEKGEAQAYISYRFDTSKPERELLVREIVWLNPAARHEIFAFIANHDSQAAKVIWRNTLPQDEELSPMFDDPRAVEESFSPGYMLRIINVPQALEGRLWPEDTNGTFSLSVTDEVLDWNNVSVRFEVEGGKARVTELPAGTKTGLACHTRQLAQMFGGFLSPHKLEKLGLLQVADRAELESAQNLFSPPGQPLAYMNDFF